MINGGCFPSKKNFKGKKKKSFKFYKDAKKEACKNNQIVYRCTECGDYHLTGMSSKKNKNLIKRKNHEGKTHLDIEIDYWEHKFN